MTTMRTSLPLARLARHIGSSLRTLPRLNVLRYSGALLDRSPNRKDLGIIQLSTSTGYDQDHPYLFPCRRFASTSSGSLDDNTRITVLYTRSNGRNTIARSLLVFSCFHTVYWTWYVVDFVPAINASVVSDLHVDPMLGYVGWTFAAFVNLSALLFPRNLLSRIILVQREMDHDGDAQEGNSTVAMQCYVHTLPWITPAPMGLEYSLGEVKLDASSSEVKSLVTRPQDSLAEYRGYLPLQVIDRRLPYLLDIRSNEEVPDSQTLLEVLVNPKSYEKRQTGLRRGPKKRMARKRVGGSDSGRRRRTTDARR